METIDDLNNITAEAEPTKREIDYSKIVMYKLVCNDENVTDLYVGSTTDFIKRKYQHKSCSNGNSCKIASCKIYTIIRDSGGWDNWQMIQIEEFPCTNGQEARDRELYWHDQLNATMNTNRPVKLSNEEYYKQTREHRKQYYEQNKDRLIEYGKKHYENNKAYYSDYYQKNKEKNKEYQIEYGKKYREKNKLRYAEYSKEYYNENKDQFKQYYGENVDTIKERSKNHYINNKEKYKEYYKANVEKYKENNKKYYEENKQKFTTKYTCECGATFMISNKSNHNKGQRHINYLNSLKENI
jgi:hypothetical protein